MRDECIHLSDEQLLLLADGEMPGRRAKEARAHLQACWQCRAQMAKIEATIIDFVRIHDTIYRKLPPAAGPRALLKGRLAELAETSSPRRWHAFRSAFATHKVVSACALMLIVALGAGMLYRRSVRPQSSAIAFAGVLPNPQLTPGATMPVSMSEICSIPQDEVVGRVPSALQRRVLKEYGVPATRADDYEVDYLITPGLGGAGDIRNLWPQPHFNTMWNSYVKDQLEERLHHLVCTGQIDLATAQRQIASNWIAAYERYFGTTHPVLNRSNSSTSDAKNAARPIMVSRIAKYTMNGSGES